MRFRQLLKVQEAEGRHYNESLVGKIVRCWWIPPQIREDYCLGRTEGNTIVEGAGPDALIGSLWMSKFKKLSTGRYPAKLSPGTASPLKRLKRQVIKMINMWIYHRRKIMDIVTLTRELGKAIQQDEMYLQLQAARANNDKDESLQKMIEDFNELRTQLSQEMNQENGDQQKLQQLDTQVPALYQDIWTTKHAGLQRDQKTVDSKMNFINKILVMSVNGEDPDMVEETPVLRQLFQLPAAVINFPFLFNEKQDGLPIAKGWLAPAGLQVRPGSPLFPFSVAQKVRTSFGIHPGFCIFQRDKAPEIGGFIVKTSVRAGRGGLVRPFPTDISGLYGSIAEELFDGKRGTGTNELFTHDAAVL